MDSKPTRENVERLQAWLDSQIAFSPGVSTYTFYEEIDRYLGYGGKGYPIEYGKKYNVLFCTDRRLLANPATRQWVKLTTVLLEEYLRDFILETYRANRLSTLTEPELREAAFDSHPRAYTRGGLTMVVLVAPHLLGHIVSIPNVEFLLDSPTFWPSVKQAVSTAGVVAGQILPGEIARASRAVLPAHGSSSGSSVARDLDYLARWDQFNRYLGRVHKAIEHGHFDRIATLQAIVVELESLKFAVPLPPSPVGSDAGLIRFIDATIAAARTRQALVASRYREECAKLPELKEVYKTFDPNWKD